MLKVRVCLTLLLLMLVLPVAQAQPQVRGGVIDLRDWNVTANPTIALNGDWLMRWGSRSAEPVPFKVPGVWNGRTVDGRKLPGFGQAWLSVTLLLPANHPPLALAYGYLRSAARFYANGRLIKELGHPGNTDAAEEPYTVPGVVSLPTQTPRVHLMLEISNHFYYEGGVDSPITIGAKAVLEHNANVRQTINILVFASTAAFALYLLLLVRGRSHIDGVHLFIALLALSSLSVLGTDGWLPWGHLPMALVYRADYLPVFLFPPLYAWLLRALFPVDVPRRFCFWVSIVDAAGVLAVVFLPVSWFTRLGIPGALIIVMTALFLFVCSLRAVSNRRPGARFVAVGVVFLGAGVIHDVMLYVHLIDSDIYLSAIGMLVFLFAHGLGIGNRLFAAWDENIALNIKLTGLNRDLDAKVVVRTRELALESTRAAQARQFAEEDARNKSRFLATLSHELRTPLAGIHGNLDLLQKDLPLGAVESRIGRIRNASMSLVDLLDGVLEVARVESRRAAARSETFAPRDLIIEINTLLEPLAMNKGLALHTDIERQVPDYLRGGAVLLRRILINLISNAIKFTDSGQITVAMNTMDGGADYRLTVTDTGRGMTAAVQERIFEEFYRESTTTESGAGMGLFIVDRLIRALDGTVSVHSEPGVGTQIVVCLPFVLSSEQVDQASKRVRSYRLLLVEDVAVNREVIAELLAHDGHRVDVVSDGEQAVAAVCERDYDAVLMDLRLREMHGDEAAQRIRALPDAERAEIPIIALTAEALALDEEFFASTGIDAVVTKPIHTTELYAELEQICVDEQGQQQTPIVEPTNAIDESRLADLIDALGIKRMRVLLLELLATLTGQCEVLETALGDDDQATMNAAAHRLVGAAENFGFVAVGYYARRVRTATATTRMEIVEELIAIVRDTIPLLRQKADNLHHRRW